LSRRIEGESQMNNSREKQKLNINLINKNTVNIFLSEIHLNSSTERTSSKMLICNKSEQKNKLVHIGLPKIFGNRNHTENRTK